MHRIVQSLYCTIETNIPLYINYTSTKKDSFMKFQIQNLNDVNIVSEINTYTHIIRTDDYLSKFKNI